MKSIFAILIFIVIGSTSPVLANSSYEYQLYKNHEDYGIVVFPKSSIFNDCNLIFGIIEIVVFTLTEKPEDIKLNKAYLQQLFGHVFPIVGSLIGMSFVSRTTLIPVETIELSIIVILFILGSTLRVLSIAQLGVLRFKFNIAFREKQTLKTDQLHGYMRHPTYTSMMLVVISYAVTTHSLYIGMAGTLLAWFGFQYRIHFEEMALKEQFGDAYVNYQKKTAMWLPFLKWKGS